MGRKENEEGYGKANRFFTKPVVTLFVTTLIGPIISGVIVNTVTKDRTYEAVQKATVEMLAAKLDYIDASDKLDDAIKKIADTESDLQTNEKEAKITSRDYEEQIKDLKKQLDEANNKVEFMTPSVKKHGEYMKNVDDSLIVYDGKTRYISTELLSMVYTNDEFVDEGDELVFNFSLEDVGEMIKDKSISLTQMEENKKFGVSISPRSDIHNNNFETCLCPTEGNSYIEYKLDKKYKWFECEFFVPSEADSLSNNFWHTASVEVTGRINDVNGYDISKYAVSKREDPTKKTGLIDISGCDCIYIKFNSATGDAKPLICVGNPKLYLDD